MDLNMYDTKVLKKRPFVGVLETTVQFTRKDKKPIMCIADIIDLVDGLQAKADEKKNNIRILVRALAIDGMKTLKGYTTNLMIQEFEDYYKNSVKDATKFGFFSNIQITIELEI